jgi:hypothetical protein
MLTVLASSVYGLSGSKLKLQARFPANPLLSGSRISIKVDSQPAIARDILIRAEKGLSRWLLYCRRGIEIVQRAPDMEARLQILDISHTATSVTRTRSEYQKTGTRTEYDQETGASHTVDVYGYVDVSYNANLVRGSVTALYELIDVKSGLALISDTLQSSYSADYEGIVPPDSLVVQEEMINQALLRINQDNCQPRISLQIPMPGGRLKETSKMILKGRFDAAKRELESMRAFANYKDEAARLYALGVIFEALAHTSVDDAEAKAYFDQAVDFYDRARIIRPDEKIYWWSHSRAIYFSSLYSRAAAWKQKVEETARSFAAGKISQAEALTLIRNPPQTQPTQAIVWKGLQYLTNEVVKGWVRAGVPEKIIIATIQDEGAVGFDLSTNEVLRLGQAGVSAKIIKAMKSAQTRRRGMKGTWLAVLLPLLYNLPFLIR